jgi:O-antigen/teichoic acid export membrane protein
MHSGTPLAPSFFRHVGLLAGASAVGPLVAFAAYPALTRLYDPQQFGVLGAFEAVLAIALSFCTLRYHLAIPVPDDDADAAALVVASVAASGTISLMMVVLLLWGDAQGLGLPGLHSIADLSWLLALATFASGTALALAGWHTRRRTFGQVAASRVTQGVVQVAVQLTLGALAKLSPGLVVGLVAARLAATTVLGSRTGLRLALREVSWRRVVAAAKRHRRLPLVSTWSAIVNIVGQQASVLIVGVSFGVETAGLYSLAFLVTVGPAHLVSQAIEQSFASRIRDAERSAEVPALARAVFGSLVAFIAVPAATFVAVAPDVFTLAFGPSWTDAGEFARYLVPSAFAAVVGAHLPSLVVLRRWQRPELVFNVVLAVARCIALLWGHHAGNPLAAVVAYGVTGAGLTLTYSCALLIAEGVPAREVITSLLRHGGVAGGIAAVLLVTHALAGAGAATFLGISVTLAHAVLTIRRARGGVRPG